MTTELELLMKDWEESEKQEVYNKADRLEAYFTNKQSEISEDFLTRKRIYHEEF